MRRHSPSDSVSFDDVFSVGLLDSCSDAKSSSGWIFVSFLCSTSAGKKT